jgi:folate-binding Fe-S cluster repair protein YgfZ
MIVSEAGDFLLDCESARLMDLGQRLGAYRLRADVKI